MKHKILGVAALLCAMLFAACSDLLEDLTPKETSSVEVETTADTDLYVHILEISGDFTLESEQSGTELRFTALDTEPGANLVWKVYKDLEDTAYTQSGSDTSFGFDTGDLEPGKYTLLVTSGTRSATAVFTVNTTVTVPVTLKTGGDINSILMQLCPDEYEEDSVCTKFARSETNNEKATLYLDTEEKYIPVWSDGTEVYYYVPDGCTPVMNEDSSEMFSDCYELTSLDVDGFDTSKVTDMSGMFNHCYGLTSLDVTGFDTSKVTDMSRMFGGCKLTELDVTGFDTSNVTNMEGMFASCSKLTGLDVSKFDTSKVTNMQAMFNYCSGLTSLDLSKFVTSKVENMSYMFSYCSSLTSLDVTGFDTSSVTNMYIMFSCCSGLTSLDVSSFNTSKVTNMSYMFYSSPALTTIYATSNFVTTNVTSGDYCFGSCTNLKGGAGTTWDSSRESADYARIDGGTDAPGYFTAKPIGSKSKPDAVGDIVFNDGSATPYTADLTLTEEEKAAAIAVIFDADKKLGVGLVQGTNLAWATGTTGFGTEFATSDTDGSGNWKVIVDAADKLTGVAADAAKMEIAAAATSYPAFNFANTYGVSVAGVASGWYLPAKDELNNLCDSYRADGSAVKEALDKCTGTINLSTGIFLVVQSGRIQQLQRVVRRFRVGHSHQRGIQERLVFGLRCQGFQLAQRSGADLTVKFLARFFGV